MDTYWYWLTQIHLERMAIEMERERESFGDNKLFTNDLNCFPDPESDLFVCILPDVLLVLANCWAECFCRLYLHKRHCAT